MLLSLPGLTTWASSQQGVWAGGLLGESLAELLRDENKGSGEAQQQHFMRFVAQLKASPVAIHVREANEQHYELPSEFFTLVLDRHRKYSSCHFDPGVVPLDDAEARMLALTCERARLADGEEILELGCGWGSLTLWMAEHYPHARITAVSNSRTQREFIEARALERGLPNIRGYAQGQEWRVSHYLFARQERPGPL